MKKRVAVFGSATLKDGDAGYMEALQIGRLLGECGCDIATGGYAGVMQAVSQGCREGGGHCLGLGLSVFQHRPNPYIDEFVKPANLGERLDAFVCRCDLFLALSGGIGTVTEVLFCWDVARAGGMRKVPILVYGEAWQKLFALLKSDFVVQDSSFNYVKVIRSQPELAEYLRNWRGTI